MAREGWYEDPIDAAGLRWWDGNAWTTHTVPNPVITPEPTPGLASEPTPEPASEPTAPTADAVTTDSSRTSEPSRAPERTATPATARETGHESVRGPGAERSPGRDETHLRRAGADDRPGGAATSASAAAAGSTATMPPDATHAAGTPDVPAWERASGQVDGGGASAGGQWWESGDAPGAGPGAPSGGGATGARVAAVAAAAVVVLVAFGIIGSIGALRSGEFDTFTGDIDVEFDPVESDEFSLEYGPTFGADERDGAVIDGGPPLGPGDVRGGDIEPRGVFAVPLTLEPDQADGLIVIDVRGDDGLDAIATLYDLDGQQVARNDDRSSDGVARHGGDPLDPLLEVPLDPGTYRLEVTGFGSSSGSFVIAVETAANRG